MRMIQNGRCRLEIGLELEPRRPSRPAVAVAEVQHVVLAAERLDPRDRHLSVAGEEPNLQVLDEVPHPEDRQHTQSNRPRASCELVVTEQREGSAANRDHRCETERAVQPPAAQLGAHETS